MPTFLLTVTRLGMLMLKISIIGIIIVMAPVAGIADNLPAYGAAEKPRQSTTPAAPPGNAHNTNVFDALRESLSEPPTWNIGPDKCEVSATIDFDKFYHRLSAFRDAWLRTDYTLEHYQIHARQILTLIIMPRMAALETSAVYNSHDVKPTTICHFKAAVSYVDKYGNSQSFNAIRWEFTTELAKKMNWERFDENRFGEIAENWRYTKGADDFNQLEQPLSSDGIYQPLYHEPQSDQQCSDFLYNANSTFIRATRWCQKDFMDSRGGMIALEASRACDKVFDEGTRKRAFMAQADLIDREVKRKGRRATCAEIERMEREVEDGKR